MIALQRCNKCMQMLEMSSFRTIMGRNGVPYSATVCKSCCAKRDGAKRMGYRHRALANPVQVCRCCGVVKSKDEFRPLREISDGLWVRAKSCQPCETKAGKRHAAKTEVDDLLPAYYPDPLHRVARDWRGPVTGTLSPSVGLVCNPWRLAA